MRRAEDGAVTEVERPPCRDWTSQPRSVRGSFLRRIRRPENCDLEHVDAEFTDGVLELHPPKTEATARRPIEVE
jgi:HSP20 family molecular chaperone IbpA